MSVAMETPGSILRNEELFYELVVVLAASTNFCNFEMCASLYGPTLMTSTAREFFLSLFPKATKADSSS
jgi:tRNA A22 N-methylase